MPPRGPPVGVASAPDGLPADSRPAELSVRRGVLRDGDREGAAERLHLAEADPLARVDVIVENSDFDRPRLLPG